MKVVVIGGGPAGMLAAISAKKQGNDVTLLEKMDKLGRKLCITGKGRCNITSSLDISEFIKNIPGNGRFLYSAFQNFDNKDIIRLLNIPTKEERGNRIFPESDRASDVLDALIKNLKGVQIITGERVTDILTQDCNEEDILDSKVKYKTKIIGVKTEKNIYNCDKVILATGGKSYPLTGSTGDGYEIAKKLGHTVTEIRPSLVALTASRESLEICQHLQGLSLKNVEIKVLEKNKIIYEDFGEMLFTHFGVSGPIILSASAHLVRTKM